VRCKVTIRDLQSNSEVEAEVYDNVTLADFAESQGLWRPVLWAAGRLLQLQGRSLPRYMHWDWTQKAPALGRLDVSFVGLKFGGHLQGLMKADTGSVNRCRLDEQKGSELVYVDYVETAPWNIPEYMEALGRKALYGRIGTRLMQAAVTLSLESELKGRIGLHALPGAEDFYRRIGMTATSRDEDKQNLLWFEFTPEAAKEFVRRYP
jgi:hypothetical protein